MCLHSSFSPDVSPQTGNPATKQVEIFLACDWHSLGSCAMVIKACE